MVDSGGGFDDFNIDQQEYQSVFKVFDKSNTGEINIQQVYDLINKFDSAQKPEMSGGLGGPGQKTGNSKNGGGESGAAGMRS